MLAWGPAALKDPGFHQLVIRTPPNFQLEGLEGMHEREIFPKFQRWAIEGGGIPAGGRHYPLLTSVCLGLMHWVLTTTKSAICL